MENRFKQRISRMFRSSFGSCRTRNIHDVIEKAVFSPENIRSFHLLEQPVSTSSPKGARPFPSICKPRCPESTQGAINHDCIMIAPRETLPRRKVSSRYPLFHVSSSAGNYFEGRKCPPASPISPLNLFAECKDFGFYEKKKSLTRNKKKKKKNNNKRFHVKSKNNMSTSTFFSSSSHESISSYNHGGSWWWFSSEDETETFFSSRTLTSDSSESIQRPRSHRKRGHNVRRRKPKNYKSNVGGGDIGVLPLVETNNKVKDSFAVVKSSSDPYNDFRTSMVEMIVERQLFAAKDLEQLLQCFLSLNSHHHHKIIVEVFTEIWETLFSNWS